MRKVPPWERNELLPDGGSQITDALHQLAVAVPDAVAAEDATTTITFAELERRSNQIANTILAAYPAGADGPVALVFGHGLGPFVTALGALCTGLAVAPLDAREPRDRVIEVVEASGASLIVTDTENAEIAQAAGAGRPMLVLDATVVSTASHAAPTVAISPDTPGFLFFTSGSTGVPKGVLSAHRQVVPRYVSLANEHGYRPGERVAVTASFGFSLAHTYFLAAVFGGATACCYDLKTAGPGGLPEWIVSRGITSVTFVPSMLRALPAHASRMDSVRLVTLGGETVYGHDVRRARAHFGTATTFKNQMGSAEAGIVATYVIPPEQPDDEPVPCGSLAPGLDVRVVDPDTGEPVDTGAPGRLVVVREHLSLRYWRDPELTAALYFTEPDGRRGFCTSDLVRFRDDGLLEHLGRLDARVKVRGAMVAPAEVEAALLASDVVADAAVVATEGGDGHTRIVAYVVPAPGETVSGWQLRRGLAQLLPMSRLPAAIVLLDQIPRTTRDKVDGDALPPAPTIAAAPYHEPRSDERALAQLFTNVLGVDPIGRNDDFFDLGGDSLAVVELIAMIDEHLGVTIPATTVLDAPTVASLSRQLQPRRSRHASVPRVLGMLGGLGHRRQHADPRPAGSGARATPRYILRMSDATEVDLAPWERNALLPNGARELSPALHEVARRRPDELAVDDGEQRITFAELLSQTNRVANAIIDRNPDPTTPVLMLCGHGVGPITGVLGVVSAGHLVSPVDARDPAERLAQIKAASGTSMIVAEREFADLARQLGPDCTVLVLDEALAYPDTAPPATIDDNTPGVIVFTSGSTGTPKGVVKGHRALVAKGLVRAFGGDVSAGDRVVLNSSFSFSATYSRILTTVLSGASLFTYDPRVKGQRGYADWVNAHEITSLSFMTSLLRALLDVPSTPRMLGVRRVQVGGETVYGIDITRARRLFRPDVDFAAGFSSTETGGVCSYTIPPEDEHDSRPVPIGVVEPWSEIRVVDPETDEPVPDGETGQLVVHNHLLALGYWRDPETTARHFFTEPDGRRWFRTNDLVRVRPTGVVEHHGRIDFRVKVRGALVGLSEVEGAVLATDGVAQCVVVGDELPEGGHRLIAYVVPEAGMTPTVRELRRDIGARLPTTMMPSAIVLLEELPAGTTGKVNRAALPAPPPPATRPYREPKGHDQELAEVFAEILAVDRVGLDDDFFDLGGDSLGVVELVAAIQERFGVDVVASTVLDAPTVAELSPKVAHRRRHQTSVVVPLSTEGTRMPFFCATGGGAPALSMRALADALQSTTAANGTSRPFYGVQPRGLEERAFPDHSVAAAAKRNLRSIRAVYPHGQFLLGGYSYGATVAFEMACQLEAAGERVPLLVILDATAPGTRYVPRAKRLQRRGAALTADAPNGALQRSATVALRTGKFAVKSASAHAERRIALTSAGLFPRRGLHQYALFLRLNGRMAREYRPKQHFHGSVLVVRSDAPPGPETPPEDFGWSACVTGPITMINAPGDHQAMMRKPAVTTLASRLAEALTDFS